MGEVALRSNDGEGKPGTKEPPRSDKQTLCQSDTIAVFMLLSGEEKKNLQVSDLLAKFQIASGGEFANDRMILS